MEKQDKDILPEAEKEGRPIGRRKLLKILAATVGAAQASFLLPEKWTKPLFDAIIVPAHAATSGCPDPKISNFTLAAEKVVGFGEFEYSDPCCQVDARYTRLDYRVSWGGGLNFNSGETIEGIPGANLVNNGTFNSTPCSGTIIFRFITQDSSGQLYPVTNSDSLRIDLNVNGRLSNVLNQTINAV